MQTILIVDDSAMTRKVVRRALEGTHFHLVEAVDGIDALEKLDMMPVQVLISDLNMPRMGGEELIANVRQRPVQPDHIVVISSTISTVRKLRLLRLGVEHVIPKPFKPELLHEQLRCLLEQPPRAELTDEARMVLDAAVVDTLAHMVFRVSMPLDEAPDFGGPSVAATVRMSGAATGSLTIVAGRDWAHEVSEELTGEGHAVDFVSELVNIVGGGIVASVESSTGQDVHLDIPTAVQTDDELRVDRTYQLEDESRLGVVWNVSIPIRETV